MEFLVLSPIVLEILPIFSESADKESSSSVRQNSLYPYPYPHPCPERQVSNVGTSAGDVYRSTDGGTTWIEICGGLSKTHGNVISAMIVDPSASNVLPPRAVRARRRLDPTGGISYTAGQGFIRRWRVVARVGRWSVLGMVLLVIGLCLWHQSSARLGVPLVQASPPSDGAGEAAKRALVVSLKATWQGSTSCYHLVATVTDGGAPVFTSVNFVVLSGPHNGQSALWVPTDANGQATWDLCDASATGKDVVSATDYLSGASATVQLQWGEFVLDLHADPYDAACYWLGATLTQNGEKVKNTNVTFTVVSGPNAGKTIQDSTGEYGTAEWEFCAPGSQGVDVITASTDGGTSDSVTLDWATGVVLEIALEKPGAGCYRILAKLTRNGYKYPGQTVNYAVANGPHKGQTATVTTDSNGWAFWDICDAGAVGIDEVTIETYGASDNVSLDWGGGLDFKLYADYDQGSYHYLIRAELWKYDIPYEGVRVDFLVVSGPHAGRSGYSTTNAQGLAFWELAPDGSLGTDKVQATAVGLKRTVNVTWENTALQQGQQDADDQSGCSECLKSMFPPEWSSK